MRDIVLQHGVISPLAYIIENSEKDTFFLRNATWAVSNLCRGIPPPAYNHIARAIPALAKVVKECSTTEILVDVCWALSYLTDSG
jgi:importin subunit alpha-1